MYRRITFLACPLATLLVVTAIGMSPQPARAQWQQDEPPPVVAAEPVVLDALDTYATEFDPASSFFDEVQYVDPREHWPDDPTAHYQMFVLTFDLTSIDPGFTGDVFVFYSLQDESLADSAGLVAYAPARTSAQAAILEPRRVHTWRRKGHPPAPAANALHMTHAVRQALELGADSLELVLYTTHPLQLSTTRPEPTIQLGNADQLGLPVYDPPPPADDPAPRGGSRTACLSCSDADGNGWLQLEVCGPTSTCCGSNSTYTVHVWGKNDERHDLDIELWDDDPFAPDRLGSVTRSVGPGAIDETVSFSVDLCNFESSLENYAEVYGYYFLHEGCNFFCQNKSCRTPNINVLLQRQLPAPTGVVATDDTYCNKIRVTWNAVSGATGYKVYRSTTNSACTHFLHSDGASPYDDSSITGGQTYYYSVKAVGPCGDSPCSNVDSGRSPGGPTAPNPPTASPNPACAGQTVTLSASGGSGGTLKWYRGGCGSGSSIGSDSPITISAPSSTTTYYVRRESTSCGNSSCRSVTLTVNQTPSAPNPPSASPNPACAGQPVTLSASGGSGGTLRWYRVGCGNGGSIGSGSQINITAPSSTTTYYVRRESSCGNSSCMSVTLTVDQPPSPPNPPTASPNPACAGQSVTLSASGGSGGTLQWYRGDCDSGVSIGSGSTIAITAPSSNATYCVRRESASCGNSPCRCVTVPIIPAPQTPSGVSATNNDCSKIRITWGSASGATGYKLYRSTNNTGCSGSPIWTGSGTSYDNTPPSCGTVYYYSVKASNQCGDSGCSNIGDGLMPCPVLITQHPSPPSVQICTNQSHDFCVTATGSGSLSYQWQKDGVSIPGATSSCYTATQAGSYRCIVSNDCGSATSNGATLTVSNTRTWYRDLDGDLCGNANDTKDQCDQPAGYVDNPTDCDDNDPSVCQVRTWYRDQDSDGLGDSSQSRPDCHQPPGYVDNPDDPCPDDPMNPPGCVTPPRGACCAMDNACSLKTADECSASSGTFKGVGTVCSGGTCPSDERGACCLDNNTRCEMKTSADCGNAGGIFHANMECSAIDCQDNVEWYPDNDHDGYGNKFADAELSATQPPGKVQDHTDCNDGDGAIHPGATEVCDDGVDNDCNDVVDDCDGPIVDPVPGVLHLNVQGEGTISRSPFKNEYASGEVVTLRAAPANGWQFRSWSGDVTGTANPVQITMDGDKNVTATMERCGAGLCGIGGLGLFPFAVLGMWFMKMRIRRVRRRSQQA